MELKKKNMIEAAAKIIYESGINALSIEKLAGEMKIGYSLLNPYFKKDEDILMFLLLSLEDEIKQMIIDAVSKNLSPEKELRILFENIYKLLENKPFFLTIIFFTEKKEKNTALQNTLLRIKKSVRTYLLEVINHGKKESVFKSKLTSRAIVNNILGSFRLFMNEHRLISEMVNDVKLLKGIKATDHQGNINLIQSEKCLNTKAY